MYSFPNYNAPYMEKVQGAFFKLLLISKLNHVKQC